MDVLASILRWEWKELSSYMVVGTILLILLLQRNINKRRLPPGPPAWPIVGNLFQLGKKPNESLFHLSQKYGPLMTLSLGTRTTVVVSSPAMAREVFRTNDHVFAGRTVIQAVKCLSHHKSSLIWADYGSRWRMLRRICSNELFSAKRLESLQHLRRDQVFRMVRMIYEDGAQGRSVDIGHTVFHAALNLLGNTIFAKNVSDPHSVASQEFKETVWRMLELGGTPNLADFFPWLQCLDPQRLCRKTTSHLRRIYAIFDEFIEDRLAARSRSKSINETETACADQKDFLEVLLDLRSHEFTLTDIRALITEMFMAGSDTTSTTVEWAMAELINNPEAMEKAQSELEEAVGRERRVEEGDIEKLPYLMAVVKEVFRLHPPVPLLLPHRAERSCEMAGYVIPDKTQLIVNVWAIGRDPTFWKEPSHFIPDRFLRLDHVVDFKGHNFELIPFGEGRRMCAGFPLASRMVHLIIASLLHSFHWTLPDGTVMDMSDKFGMALHKAIPLTAVPTPRLPSSLLS